MNNSTGGQNVAVGRYALLSNTTADYNTAVGYQANLNGTTGGINTFVGALSAGNGVVTGTHNVGHGAETLYSLTSGSSNVGVGYQALQLNTTGNYNVAIGREALEANTTASNNTAVGYQAGYANTTGEKNTSLGKQALYNTTTVNGNTALGFLTGYTNTTGAFNTYVGMQAGYTGTGSNNTFVGVNSGYHITSGAANTILGRFNGNDHGLDLRTSSNNIVLSDGDGNPRMWVYNGYSNFSNTTSWQSGGIDAHSFEQSNGAQDVLHLRHPAVSGGYGLFVKLDGGPNNTTNYFFQASDTTATRFRVYSNGNVVNTNNSYGSISDIKLKENIVDSGSQWDDIKALTVRKYSMKADNLDAPNMLGVIAQEVEAAGMGGLVITSPDLDPETKEDLGTVTKQVNYSILYMKAVKALQEAMDRIETLEAKVTALENA